MLIQGSSAVVLPLNQRTVPAELSHNGNVALAYAKAGLPVFPCSAERKKPEPGDRLPFGKADKRPLVSSWSKEASKDELQIREWWTQNPEALVGLPCKQNRLFVLDADRHTAEEDGVAAFATLCEGQDEPMPAHPVVATDYEGEHHVFQMPEEPISNRKVGVGIETRGYQLNNDGGYIIAAGSLMPDGRGWKRMEGTPSLRDALPLPPGWLVELCSPPKPQASTAQQTTYKPPGKAEEAYAIAALDRAAAELASMKPSTGRDNKLLSVAGTMGRMIGPGWIGQATVEGRLFDACRANGLAKETGDAGIRDKIKRGIEATISNPHPPLPERQRGNGYDDDLESDEPKEEASGVDLLRGFAFLNEAPAAPQAMLIEDVLPLEGLPFIGAEAVEDKAEEARRQVMFDAIERNRDAIVALKTRLGVPDLPDDHRFPDPEIQKFFDELREAAVNNGKEFTLAVECGDHTRAFELVSWAYDLSLDLRSICEEMHPPRET